jgi:hypothetical protein
MHRGIAMYSAISILATERARDLDREAHASHLANLAREAREAREGAPSAWRRRLGRGARGMSDAFDSLAARLDPSELCADTRPASLSRGS